MDRFRLFNISAYLLIVMSLLVLVACGGRGAYADEMDAAEGLMETRPDSAMKILDGIDRSNLTKDSDKARYALLKSMALDKNYIDTTTFEVLQPAVDYYLRKGSPDERLRTYYYQGCIYQNAGDYEKSMDAYINGRDLMSETTDTLNMARLLTAQGTLFYKQYKFREFVENSLISASLFGSINEIEYEYRSLGKALGGAINIKNKTLADSIIHRCKRIKKNSSMVKKLLDTRLISYHVTFDTQEDLRIFIDSCKNLNMGEDDYLNIAYAYYKLDEGEKALEYLNKVNPSSYIDIPLKYLTIKAKVLESVKDYENSLIAYRSYVETRERIEKNLMSDSLLFAERRHQMEINSSEALRKKDRVILIWSISAMMLIMLSSFLYFRYRLAKSKRAVAEMETENLTIQKQALEKDKLASELRADNMRLRINELEEEQDELKDMLRRNGLTDSMRRVIKERLTMLNDRLAKDITERAGESGLYDSWIKSIRRDSEKFIQSNQIAFRVSHPGFIKCLEERGLTEYEIGYVCLYALGMLGKEVGEFIKLKGHYNLSTAIRKKLGIAENATALKVYVKNLLDKC